jgi:chitin disaccharide deacetylase
MLIINADDFGKTATISDNILSCFKSDRITSTSAMVFMRDSERAASLCLQHNFDVGLHLNLDEQFNGSSPTALCKESLDSVATFLTKSKYSQVIYNPLLRRKFQYLYHVQYEEFIRLYRRPPSHINGHHHMHLCANVLLGRIIPRGARVRRSFTFGKSERSNANRLYRRFLDHVVKRRFITTDMFFGIISSEDPISLKRKVELAKVHSVELMVHVSSQKELDYLMQQNFFNITHTVTRGTYRDLPGD